MPVGLKIQFWKQITDIITYNYNVQMLLKNYKNIHIYVHYIINVLL